MGEQTCVANQNCSRGEGTTLSRAIVGGTAFTQVQPAGLTQAVGSAASVSQHALWQHEWQQSSDSSAASTFTFVSTAWQTGQFDTPFEQQQGGASTNAATGFTPIARIRIADRMVRYAPISMILGNVCSEGKSDFVISGAAS
jgi:hypothetical protein